MSFRYLLFVVFAALASSGAHAQCTGSATYVVTNDCMWTGDTHPTDYPSNAYFGHLCGTTHSEEYTMFYEGGYATAGVKEVAETGGCDTLKYETDECVTQGYCAADGWFKWQCDTSTNPYGVSGGVCTHSGTLYVDWQYPYVSMMSKIAPSPDWYVGVSNVNLCRKDDYSDTYYWVDEWPLDGPRGLLAWDAGTDTGATYLAPDYPANPYEAIYVYRAEDATNIFYNQRDYALYPLCHLILKKI